MRLLFGLLCGTLIVALILAFGKDSWGLGALSQAF
jgi:hypothetical protein